MEKSRNTFILFLVEQGQIAEAQRDAFATSGLKAEAAYWEGRADAYGNILLYAESAIEGKPFKRDEEMNGDIYIRMRCQFCDKWAACKKIEHLGYACIPCDKKMVEELKEIILKSKEKNKSE